MSKYLPYFQFEPAEYLTKDVSFCSLSAQGLFINLCAHYWQRECKLTKSQFLRRYNNETELNELIDEQIIYIDEDDNLAISFLDAQYFNATKTSRTNSENGKKGGRPKKPKETETKPTALNSQSETKGIREDKRKEEDIREDKRIPEFKDFLAHAVSKVSNVKHESVKLKYESWIENDWKDGNDKKIVNWKSKLTNTVQYLDRRQKKTSEMDKPERDAFLRRGIL